MTPKAPHIDWEALSPLVALLGGAAIVLLLGLSRSRFVRAGLIPVLTLVTLGVTVGLGIWQWDRDVAVIEGALAIDNLTLTLTMLFCAAGIATVLLSVGAEAAEQSGHGEFHAMLLSSVSGMFVLVAAQNLVAVFIGFELLSIPLYVLCATELRRATSLESGLKYLIVGSVGSATLLYGLALVYGAAGTMDFGGIDQAISAGNFDNDVLFMTGVALALVGLAFKASVAPFHQWTPDVYEGAPTPVTAFMAVATKAAAFGVLLRLFDVALVGAADDWAPFLAVLAAVTIAVGNVGALGQSSLKRLLAYSSVAQAGYLLTGVVVTTQLGVRATVFYLAVYLLMNLAAFAVIVVRERESGAGDDITSLNGLGHERPWLAWPMTIAMLALAGLPATAGFWGKIFLIDAAVDNDYAWLGVTIVLGSALSLAYYLRVVAAIWSGAGEPAVAPAPGRIVMAGGSPELDEAGGGAEAHPAAPLARDEEEAAAVARALGSTRWATAVGVVCAVAVVFFGIYPDPLFDVARDAGSALDTLI